MRINRQILLNVAADAVSQRVRQDRSVLAALLCGSLLRDDYLLGGATDIDLVLIHYDTPPVEREVVRLTDEIHLDIAHFAQKDWREPRRLRLHPWLGPMISSGRSLHDPQHFLDFTQASVRGQFERPDHVFERARALLQRARQEWVWLTENAGEHTDPMTTKRYLKSLEQAANTVASLNNTPLTERRLLAEFPARAAAAGQPGLYAGVLGLLGVSQVSPETLNEWLQGWESAFEALSAAGRPVRLHPARFAYYRRAIQALLAGERPLAASWPLFSTWTLAATRLPVGHPAREAWQAACQQLGLCDAALGERLKALDSFLDTVEALLEEWAARNGV